MPVYEFYCIDCHTIFNFLSRRIVTDRRPACPRCGKPDLDRQVSPFAVSKGRAEEAAAETPEFDEAGLERAMSSLAGEMEGMDENDPRATARFLRRFTEAAGLKAGNGIDEAIDRLEAGEDPETIEEKLGDLLQAGNPFTPQGVRGLKRKCRPPAHDDTLYPL